MKRTYITAGGGIHGPNYGCTRKQQASSWQQRGSPVSESEFYGWRAHRFAQAYQQHEVARTGNGHRCNPRCATRDDPSARALLGLGIRLAQMRGKTERLPAI